MKADRAIAALEGVNLAFNKIGAEGGAALVEALKTSNIKFLGIGKQFETVTPNAGQNYRVGQELEAATSSVGQNW